MLYMLSFIRKYLLSCHHHCVDASPKYTRQECVLRYRFSHPDTVTMKVLQVLTCNLG